MDLFNEFWDGEDERLKTNLHETGKMVMERIVSAMKTARDERRQDFRAFMEKRQSARANRIQSRREFMKRLLEAEGKARRERLKEKQHGLENA